MAFIKNIFILLATLNILHSLPTNVQSTLHSQNDVMIKRSFSDAYNQTTIDYDQANFDEIAKDPTNVNLAGVPDYNNIVEDNDQGVDFFNGAAPTSTSTNGLMDKVSGVNDVVSDEDTMPIQNEPSMAVNHSAMNNKEIQQNKKIKQNHNYQGSSQSSNSSRVESLRKTFDIDVPLTNLHSSESIESLEEVLVKGIVHIPERLHTRSNSKNNTAETPIVTYSIDNSKKYNARPSEMDWAINNRLSSSSSEDFTSSEKILSTRITVGKESESMHRSLKENIMSSSVEDSTESNSLNSAEYGSNKAVSKKGIDKLNTVNFDSSTLDENSNPLESNSASREKLNFFKNVSTVMFIADTSSENAEVDDSNGNDDRQNSSVIVTLEQNRLAEDMLIASLSKIESNQDSLEDTFGVIITANTTAVEYESQQSTEVMSTKRYEASKSNDEYEMLHRQKNMYAIRKCFGIATDGSGICYAIRSLLQICHLLFQYKCNHSSENDQKNSKYAAISVASTSSTSSQDFSSENSVESEDEEMNNISFSSETRYWNFQQSSESSNSLSVETMESVSASLEQMNGILEVLNSIKGLCPMLCALDKEEPETISKTNNLNYFIINSIDAFNNEVSGETDIIKEAGSHTTYPSQVVKDDNIKSHNGEQSNISFNSLSDETNDDTSKVHASGEHKMLHEINQNSISDESNNSSV